MAQRDYILRQIEQMAAVLARALARVRGREAPPEQLRRELQEAAGSLGADLALARSASPATLLMLLSSSGEPDPARAWLFAEALYIDGLAAHLDGDTDDAADLLLRARILYDALDRGTFRLAGVPPLQTRLAEIEALLPPPP
jgi:hypothetical protein